MPEPIRVFICEDHGPLRALMTGGITRDPRCELVGEAGDGASALDGIAEQQPDLVVLDLAMPGSHGIDSVRAVRRCAADAKILIVTGMPLEPSHPLLEQSDGFLLKPVAVNHLVERVVELAG
jgi:DNA-binding NarL/FixJ family response regulator